MMRYHGELSHYVDEALTAADLEAVQLLSGDSGRGRGITAIISHSANDRLRSAGKQRGCTVTVLANSALKEWLGGRHAA
jgi:transcriptional regulator of aromatic amino acid metabolism